MYVSYPPEHIPLVGVRTRIDKTLLRSASALAFTLCLSYDWVSNLEEVMLTLRRV